MQHNHHHLISIISRPYLKYLAPLVANNIFFFAGIIWNGAWLAQFTLRTSMHCKWPIKWLLWYSSVNYFVLHLSNAASQVAPLSSTTTSSNIWDSVAMWCRGCGDQRIQRVSSLTPLIRTLAVEVTQLTSGDFDTDAAESRESMWCHRGFIPAASDESWEQRSTLTLFGKEISPSDDKVTPRHYFIDTIDSQHTFKHMIPVTLMLFKEGM